MKLKSLRSYLLIWLLVPLAGVVLINVFNGYRAARHTADMVTNRTLLAAANDIAEEVSVIDNVIDVQIPPAAIEMFNTGHGDLVYYSVTTRNGQLLAGLPDLPAASQTATADPAFFAHTYRGRPMSLVSLAHPVVGADGASPVTIVVGQTLNGHRAMVLDLLEGSILQQLILIAGAALLVHVGLARGLAPLLWLRDAVLDDKRDALAPLPTEAVQTELRPLIDALNQYKSRVRAQMATQSRFIANAAHQIKTPLTLLATQAAFAERAADPAERAEALGALQTSTRQLAHLVNQLLTLSRAEPGARRPRADLFALEDLARSVLEDFAGLALSRDIDLGFQPSERPAMIVGDETMLREMIVNLVDNALRYTPTGGVVTVSVLAKESTVSLVVADNGPGIPSADVPHVFERFYRVLANGGEGSGLGLAIVQEIVATAGGTVALAAAEQGSGLTVTVTLPVATAPAAR